jgi:hypothetical protein
MSTPHQSEVAYLVKRIQAEYESAMRGLTGLTYGTPQHLFITQKMETMSRLHNELQTHVGDQAIALITDALDAALQTTESSIKIKTSL